MKTRRHDGRWQMIASKRSVLTEETGHRPNLRNSYVTSPLRNAAPSHAPCDGRMTGTGRSPGSRIVAVARLPRLSPSGMMDNGSPLTVAGAASEWPYKRRFLTKPRGGTEFPIRQLALAPVPWLQSTGEGLPCQ